MKGSEFYKFRDMLEADNDITTLTGDELQRLIDEAVAAECERCAKVAESYGIENEWTCPYTVRNIAGAIRKGDGG